VSVCGAEATACDEMSGRGRLWLTLMYSVNGTVFFGCFMTAITTEERQWQRTRW